MTTQCKKYDYIIVGAGTAGAVLARTISDLCLSSILVLDMGNNHGNDPRVLDATKLLEANSTSDIVETYMTLRDLTLGNERYEISLGRGWGGNTCSSNMIAARPSQSWLKNLESSSGISLALLNDYYAKVEKYVPQLGSVADSSRGVSGKMIVTQLPVGGNFMNLVRNDVANLVTEANDPAVTGLFGQLGLLLNTAPYSTFQLNPTNDDYNSVATINANENVLVSRQQVFAADLGSSWLRQFTGLAYLGDDLLLPSGNSNKEGHDIRLIDRAKVTKIHFKDVQSSCTYGLSCNCGDRVRPYAVDAWVDNSCCTFYARCGVILAAGAIENATLLQRSGVGPSSVLDKLCIKRVVANEHVGRHVTFHAGFQVNFWLQTDPAVVSPPDPADINSQLSTLGFVYDNNMVLTLPPCVYQTYQNNYTPVRHWEVLAQSNDVEAVATGTAGPAYGVSINVSSLLPREMGTIDIVALDAFTRPNINLPSFCSPAEKASAIAIYKQIATAVNTWASGLPAGTTLIWPDSGGADPTALSDDLVYELIINSAYKSNLASSTRMGNRGEAVLDTDFQVQGTCNLFVADNSAIPLTPDADSEWTSMVIGMHVGQRIAEKCERRPVPVCNKQDFYNMCRRVVQCSVCMNDPCTCRQCIIEQYDPCQDEVQCCPTCFDEEECGCDQPVQVQKSAPQKSRLQQKKSSSGRKTYKKCNYDSQFSGQ